MPKTDTSEAGLERLICKALTGAPSTSTRCASAPTSRAKRRGSCPSTRAGTTAPATRRTRSAQVSATVGHAQHSKDLRRFIEGGKKIIISTVQKFPVILDKIGSEHRDRCFAIVIDEAHSSQGGRTSAAMSTALSAAGAEAEDETDEDRINRAMGSKKLLPNASYFAFTATPKNKTLEIFGEPMPPRDGKVPHRPFHSYTMKQAIEEGFILDVLRHYTPVASYYKLVPKLPAPVEEDLSKGILEAIDMDSYRVEKQATMRIQLPDDDGLIAPVPTAGGGHKPEPELDRLSNILKTFNDQFGNIRWADTDRVHKLITEDIPARVAADSAYQNAKQNSDKQNARIEHDKALARVMTAVLEDDTELFKQFSDNEGFRRWLTDMVFGLTYKEVAGVPGTVR